MDAHATDAVVADPSDRAQTCPSCSPAGGAFDSSELVCGPLSGGGWQNVPDRLLAVSAAVRRNGHVPNGNRSQLAHDLADGQGALRDTRTLIVDDSTLYREYLATVLAGRGVSNPGVAWDLPSLVAALETVMPKVILLNMATRDSTMLLRQALRLNPTARVIVLGMTEDDESEIVSCAEAGAAGYHLRSESLEDLLLLIRKVAAGESLCSPRVSAILLRRLSDLASQRPPAEKGLVLTAREAQILRMLELGLSNREIAEELCIALHTVKNHIHNLLSKLGVSSRAQAAALSRTLRYTESDSRN